MKGERGVRMKEFAFEDPMELHGVACGGDAGYMVDCVIEEYLRLGWPPARILRLFESPLYPPLHQVLRRQGVEAIRRKIESTAGRCGVFRFRTHETPPDPELVSLERSQEGGGNDE